MLSLKKVAWPRHLKIFFFQETLGINVLGPGKLHPLPEESPYPWINDELQKHSLPKPKAGRDGRVLEDGVRPCQVPWDFWRKLWWEFSNKKDFSQKVGYLFVPKKCYSLDGHFGTYLQFVSRLLATQFWDSKGYGLHIFHRSMGQGSEDSDRFSPHLTWSWWT